MAQPGPASGREGGDGVDAADSASDTEAPESGIEEIIVTGEGGYVLEPETQTSSMAFTGEDLEAVRVSDIRDMAEITPNLEIKTGGGASNATLFIRGIGLNDYNANASSSVAVFNDGVYVNSPAGQLFQFFDLSGSDVLRGPQGTLYGRNVTAGAIRVFSTLPSNEAGARVNMTFGNFDLVDIEGGVTIPLLPELAAVRVAGKFKLRDGITKNRCHANPQVGPPSEGNCNRGSGRGNPPIPPDIPDGLPEWVNEIDTWASRAIFQVTPTPESEFRLNIHGGQSRGDARQNQMRGTTPLPGDPTNRFGRNSLGYADIDDDPYAGAYDLVDNENLDLFGASLTAKVDFDHFSLTSITAYEQNHRAYIDNSDAAPSYLIVSDIEDRARQWSEDLRIESTESDTFQWRLGALFVTEELRADNTFRTGSSVGLFLPTRQKLKQEFYHAAIFAFGSYEPTESLRIEAGARFAWEHKDFSVEAFRFLALNPSAPTLPRVPYRGDRDATWHPLTGDVILTWSPTESVDFYAKYARGWKTGHFNGGAARADILIDPVDPESVNAFEVGLHSTWLDERLQLDVAFFYYDYKDYQVFALQNQPDSLPLAQLLNAQDVESRGFELSLEAEPVEGLRWHLAVGWTQAKFGTFTTSVYRVAQNTHFCGGAPSCLVPVNNDYSGNALPAAPLINVSTGVQWEFPMGRFGSLTPRLDASYKSKIYFDHQGDDAISQAPFWLLHARLSYQLPGDKISVSAWARNLTDQAYLLQAFDLREVAATILDVYGDPRTFGLTLGMTF